MDSLEKNYRRNKMLVYTALTAGAVLMIFPFIWMVLTSISNPPERVYRSLRPFCRRSGW